MKIRYFVLLFIVLLLFIEVFSSLRYQKPKPKENTKFQEYSDTEEKVVDKSTKIDNETVDFSNMYSKQEKKEIRISCEELLDTYLPLYFNYNLTPSEENNKIFDYHNPNSEDLKDAKTTFWKEFEEFVSKYKNHEISYFYIQDTKIPVVETAVIVHANMQAKQLKNNDYDVFVFIRLINTENGWKVETFIPSGIFENNTAFVKKSDISDDYLTLEGEYVSTFNREVKTKEILVDDKQKEYGDIIEDDENENNKEESENDEDIPEKIVPQEYVLEDTDSLTIQEPMINPNFQKE